MRYFQTNITTSTQVTLTESETQAIQKLSQLRGVAEEQILHEAIEQFLAQHKTESRIELLRQARGLWKGREDLPDFSGVREEWDRF